MGADLYHGIYHVPTIGRDWFQSDKGCAQPNYDMFEDSVLPVIEAGQARMVDRNGGEVLPGVTCMPTPGHSIDHMSVVLASGGDVAMFGGDVMHNPAQVYRPSWNSRSCVDGEQARQSRRIVLDLCANRGAMYFSKHFADTSAGRITGDGDRFSWLFE